MQKVETTSDPNDRSSTELVASFGVAEHLPNMPNKST